MKIKLAYSILLYFNLIIYSYSSFSITRHINFSMTEDSIKLSEYKGNYLLAEGSPFEKVIITIKDSSIYASGGEFPETKLTFSKEGEYIEENFKVVFQFIRIEGYIRKIHITGPDIDLWGAKEKDKLD